MGDEQRGAFIGADALSNLEQQHLVMSRRRCLGARVLALLCSFLLPLFVK
jgi:hypothetical protein